LRHPKLIVDEDSIDFGFMGLTESEKKGKHHSNFPLKQNPKKGYGSKAYLRKKIKYDSKNNFGPRLTDYKLSSEDRKNVEEYVKRHKKR